MMTLPVTPRIVPGQVRPCRLCGRTVSNDPFYIRIRGGQVLHLAESYGLPDVSREPVGMECLRRFPDLWNYVER